MAERKHGLDLLMYFEHSEPVPFPMSATLRYNQLAPIYDWGIAQDYFYREARHLAIDGLHLTPGTRVMVLFCGTGLDFAPIKERIGETGVIYAVDGSAGMLKRARKRGGELAFSDDQIQFVQANFSNPMDVQKLCSLIHSIRPDGLLISMGLNCMSQWQGFLVKLFQALKPGTRVSMFDLYAEQLNFRAWLLNCVGAGDCRRKTWQAFAKGSDDVSLKMLPADSLLGVSLFSTSGTIPADVSK
ncbi:class I SAM-dependent methyltransferase [Verrucomicrobiaceae bacterium 5K15]|uniref:Class I SAM-dependent methyltransferase n=1 Tax=Oceaniferula flava TaxID=2800421 RepID=A0AAE2V9W9_9BACT|nr:methyltransferase domain-containing protein [Oceaniferula flavus]MBK1855868.1 class I SAM-dependent methyltransferase [Oceaniferula flavus]MBM1137175.1 class I SAM-dependent methyltransferase [Oceaniferula flavus]